MNGMNTHPPSLSLSPSLSSDRKKERRNGTIFSGCAQHTHIKTTKGTISLGKVGRVSAAAVECE